MIRGDLHFDPDDGSVQFYQHPEGKLTIFQKPFKQFTSMNDEVLGHLREARALLNDEKNNGGNSRELSVTITEIDTAILWRQEDLRLKTPPKNEAEK